MLIIEELGVCIGRPGGDIPLLTDISCSINRSEIVVLIGRSGSGKSTLLRAIGGVLPDTDFRIQGEISLDGKSLLRTNSANRRRMLRRKVRSVFQNPAGAFHPLLRIETQITSAGLSREEVTGLFERLGLDEHDKVLRSFPHQLSAGMLQRIMVSMVIASRPDLILADEPTSAVDALQASAILGLLQEESRNRGMGVLMTTHDLRIARSFGDTIVVMHQGMLVEIADRMAFFDSPSHPSSKSLVNSAHIGRGQHSVAMFDRLNAR